MGKPSREKGARAERELVKLLPGARKVSRAWDAGHDLEWMERTVEVKRRADAFKRDYQWLEDVQILAKRSDGRPWLITMELETLLDLIDSCITEYVKGIE